MASRERCQRFLERQLSRRHWGAELLGSFLPRKLRNLNAEVFVPRSRRFDLTQANPTRRMNGDAAPQGLIHIAARVGGISISRESPARYFLDDRVIGLNVIEEGRRNGGVEKLVVMGTTCSYLHS